MQLSGTQLLLISLATIAIISSSINASYAQIIQDPKCTGCIQISSDDRLELHRLLKFPIILWAQDYQYNFDHNSVITINGHSNLNNPQMPITITVTNPIGNLVTVEQIMVTPNTDFKVQFKPSGPLWKQDGMYVIKAQAGPQSTIFKTNVNLISSDSLTSLECNSNEITVRSDKGGQYCIPFETTFATSPPQGFLSTATKTLTLSVHGNLAQVITLDIDRKLLNAESPSGGDTSFVVMVNGKSAVFEEKPSDLAEHRTLAITHSPGDVTIEITGTYVIPEFGSVAVLILVTAIIVGVVLTSKRFPLTNQFPKFQ